MIAAGLLVALAATMLGFAGLGMTGHMAAHMGAVAVAAPVLSFPRGSGVPDCRLRGVLWQAREAFLAELDRSRLAGCAAPPAFQTPAVPAV